MYPHTITIYHKESDANGDSYERYVLDGVYINESSALKLGSVTFTLDRVTRISVCKETSEDFGVSWLLSEGDRIVRDIGDDIPEDFSFSMLEDALTVTGYKYNRAGSDLDGIVIDCK